MQAAALRHEQVRPYMQLVPITRSAEGTGRAGAPAARR